MRKSTSLVLAVLIASLVAAPEALGSTATVSGGKTVNVDGQGNEANRLRVAYDPALDAYLVTDVVPITGSGACANVSANAVSCPGAGIVRVSVDGRGGSDAIELDRATIPMSVTGNLDGGQGDDMLLGHDGDGSLSGGSGRDFLDGGGGSDSLGGGRGTDTVGYADRVTGVSVTVGSGSYDDGNEFDQSGARRDSVRSSVEVVIGGPGPDRIVGDRSKETLHGGDGDDLILGGRGRDVLSGGMGNDALFGQRGSDVLFGDFGDDHLSGGADNDRLHGSDGTDRLLGGPGHDRLLGGPGDDFLKGKKGFDAMFGQTGLDRIHARDGRRDRKINCGPGPRRLQWAKRDRRRDPRAKHC